MHPISVCIIAKNEEKRIEKCLASIKPYGFEIVVVDTGSTDRTKEIASRYADQVLDYVWCDDFAAARNFSLRIASNNWIFMMDCDEWIKTIDVEELNYFRKHYPDSVGAISRENLVTENGKLTLNNTDYTERFFNKKLYHYTGIIHEQLRPIRGSDLPCLLLHTTIDHTGYDMTYEEQVAKGRRNLTLLHKQLNQEPENPYVYYQLGKGYEIINDYASACEYYGKGLYFDVDPELAYVQAMVVSYGNALLRTNQAKTALQFENIYESFSHSADFVYLMGRIYTANEIYPQAIEQFYKATTIKTCKLHGANSFLSFYSIGAICEKLGDVDNAVSYYRKCGDYAPAMQKLAQLSSPAPQSSAMRIALFGSDIFILQYIMEQYQYAFHKLGCETFIFPAVSSQEAFTKYAEELFLFHEKGLDAVVTFNNRGFLMPLAGRGCLWDKWKVPCFNLLVDHPMYYYDTLDQCTPQGIVACADRKHVEYVRRFYPAVHNAFFLPTAGENRHPKQSKTPIINRPIDVLFIGSYKYHTDYVYDATDEAVMDYLICNPHETLEHAIEICLNKTHSELTDAELKLIIQQHRFVETNLSAMYRLEILRAIADSGITISVYGNGWENTDLYSHPSFDVHPPVSFEEGFSLMEQSKIVLNQMSWFKDGGSERIFNAMLQQAVCVTDDSRYLKEQFHDKEELVFYSLSSLEQLPVVITELLRQPALMQQIADRGYQAAASRHTWEQRTVELIGVISDYIEKRKIVATHGNKESSEL